MKAKYIELVKNLNWSLPKWKSNAVEGIETQLDMKRGDQEAVYIFSQLYPNYDMLIDVSARMFQKGDRLEGIDVYNLIKLCNRHESVSKLIAFGYQMIYQEKFPKQSPSILLEFMEG